MEDMAEAGRVGADLSLIAASLGKDIMDYIDI